MNTFSKYWWLALIKGILLILLAFFVFRHPVNALVGVAIYIGITLMLTGIVEIIGFIATKDIVPKWGWGLVGGIMDLIFGIILLSNPVLSAATLPFIIGFLIIFYGIMTFANSFTEKRNGNANWWMGVIYGILSILI